ncbi:DgyrCDS14934 [Dimorphilus gyrociliatus]|uniref:DgyrCDS14934 n=1 Tax=Dimorphilus gyrociliatus TaxID=2664684 RepID=A0A7I8WFL2_9ANNE|nr:DgyrCDS14934 [Dimorphilus gyrociliatus]
MDKKLLIVCLVVCLSLQAFSLSNPSLKSILKQMEKREEMANMLENEMYLKALIAKELMEKRGACQDNCEGKEGIQFVICMNTCNREINSPG